MDASLAAIKRDLFHEPGDYTKNQPDLFLPHRFRPLPPFKVGEFLSRVRARTAGREVLLYVHLPFCFSECLFCNSFPMPLDRAVQRSYLEDLLREIDLVADQGVFEGSAARGLYFGGGTPTSFPTAELGGVIAALVRRVPRAEGSGVSVEAHPDSLAAPGRVEELAAIGVTRISMGCQSFDPEVLALCNRRNDAATVAGIVERAHQAGIAVNLDMMTGLPGQTVESVRRDLAMLSSIGPDAVEYIRHEIVNPLVITLLRERPELLAPKEELFEMVLVSQSWMERNGYEQNGRYTGPEQWEYRYHWLHEMPIVAFGVRARSYADELVWDKYEDLASYGKMIARGIPPIGRHLELTAREQMYRAFFLGMQLKEGVNEASFRSRFGTGPDEAFATLLARLDACGCIEREGGAIRLTRPGAYFVEDVCDAITDAALLEESTGLARSPHSEGSTSGRLDPGDVRK